jgi:NACalpha-BTF3-like transcription factor
MSTPQPTSIEAAIGQLPPQISKRSGSVFYSGPSAFEGHRPLYILGLNPGGSPIVQADETIARALSDWKALNRPWSAYLDESWQGRSPGTHGMQPRMRHMFDQLGLDLREVPASNVVFVRSANETALAAEKATLLPLCWPVHETVINNLSVRTILCLGGTAGRWVRDAMGAHRLLDRFSEQNARGWTSEAHIAPDGRAVVTVTHPGRADWRNPAADPTPLVRAVIDRVA